MVVTVAERRAHRIARLRAAAAEVMAELVIYGRANGVRFIVFGSFARGDIIETSDLDIVIEGPEECLKTARDAAEELCERNGLRSDIHLVSEVSDGLMMRIRRDGCLLA